MGMVSSNGVKEADLLEVGRSQRQKNSRRKKQKRNRDIKKVVAVVLIIAIVVSVRFMTDAYLDNKAMDYLKTGEVPSWVDSRLLDEGNKSRPQLPLDEVNGIVIHYVANPGSSAEANRNYFNNPDTVVSSHFVVGLDGEIIQCVPLYEQSVASNSRNVDTIAIEVCHPDESGKFSMTTMNSLIKLTGWLMTTCRLAEDDIIRHYDITGKLCPKYYVEHEDAWEDFKSQLK